MFEDIILEQEAQTLMAIGDYSLKELYMESSTDADIPDLKSKWVRFKNWVTRAIYTILAKIQGARFRHWLKKCQKFNMKATGIQINQRDKNVMDQLIKMDSKKNSYTNGDLAYHKDRKKDYEKIIAKRQNVLKAFEDYKNKSDETTEINGKYLDKYVTWFENQGKIMVEKLPKLNHDLNVISSKLSADYRDQDVFRQWVFMITVVIQADLKIVTLINDIMKSIVKNNDLTTEGDDEEDEETTTPEETPEETAESKDTPASATERSSQSPTKPSSGSDSGRPAWTNKGKNIMTLSAVDSMKKAAIKSNGKKHFDKHRTCKRVYMKLDKDNDTVLNAWEENGRWIEASWKISKKMTGLLAGLKGLVVSTFKSIGTGYLDRKDVL